METGCTTWQHQVKLRSSLASALKGEHLHLTSALYLKNTKNLNLVGEVMDELYL